MKKTFALLLAAVMMIGLLAGCGGKEETAPETETPADGEVASELNVGVFYYNFADAYITTVRTAMDKLLDEAGVTYNNFDGQTNQAQQLDQINTAITNGANLLIVNIVETSSPDAAQKACDAAKEAGIPIIFFNREVADEVVNSYDKCAFVGTDAPEAGHMQGEMIGDFLLENYEATDLNGDGTISYVMFKGQEGNNEAEYRTQYAVEDANKKLTEAGKPELKFYDENNASKYLVDPNGAWSAQAATDYMNTILAGNTEANGNMVELVICNNDGMAQGVIGALQNKGYNKEGAHVVPVFGVDAIDPAKELIKEGAMAGTVKQDAEGLAAGLRQAVEQIISGKAPVEALAAVDGEIFSLADNCASKLYVAYQPYTGE